MIRKYIDKDYLEKEFLWENKNINGDTLFTDKEIEFLIQKASERINSILTVNNFDTLESLTVEAQDAIKLMVANQFLTYTLNGVNYLDIIKKISVGGINVEQQVNSAYPDIPAEVFDLGTKAGLIEDSFVFQGVDSSGSSIENSRDPVFSSQYATGEFVFQLGVVKTLLEEIKLEEDPEFVLEFVSKGKLFEYINDISVGALSFNTGELISDMNLVGDANDFEIYKKVRIDEIINGLTNLVNTKITIGDSPSNEQWNTKNNSQDIFIRNNIQQINLLKNIIVELEQIIAAGGLTVEIFKASAEQTITNTPTKINPTIDIESQRPTVLTYTQETGYKKYIVGRNGTMRVFINGSLEQGNTSTPTLLVELIDEATGLPVSSSSKDYDFANGTNLDNQSSRLQYAIADIDETTTKREFSIRVNTVGAGDTIIAKDDIDISVEMLSSVGSGEITTSDDFLNASNVAGATGTDAFNTLDANKAELSYVNELDAAQQEQIDDKLDSRWAGTYGNFLIAYGTTGSRERLRIALRDLNGEVPTVDTYIDIRNSEGTPDPDTGLFNEVILAGNWRITDNRSVVPKEYVDSIGGILTKRKSFKSFK